MRKQLFHNFAEGKTFMRQHEKTAKAVQTKNADFSAFSKIASTAFRDTKTLISQKFCLLGSDP